MLHLLGILSSILILLSCPCYRSQNNTEVLDGLQLCQLNCGSADRISGPTRMPHTRSHPWKIAPFPSKTIAFCKLGCQLFFSELPNNTTCKRMCDYYYRFQGTDGYSDLTEEALLECRDGCQIGYEVCQAGYYCDIGEMTPCPPGKYREAVVNVSIVALDTVHKCVDCPYGRYRPLDKGTSPNDCTLCPIGTYANKTGCTEENECLRCPAGKHAEQPGMRLCKCITPESCDMPVFVEGHGVTDYFQDGVDYYRETVPFIGRW